MQNTGGRFNRCWDTLDTGVFIVIGCMYCCLATNNDDMQLLEVVLDLGRIPIARFPSGDVRLSEDVVSHAQLEAAVALVLLSPTSSLIPFRLPVKAGMHLFSSVSLKWALFSDPTPRQLGHNDTLLGGVKLAMAEVFAGGRLWRRQQGRHQSYPAQDQLYAKQGRCDRWLDLPGRESHQWVCQPCR